MTIKVLIYVDTILCVLCLCAYGQTWLNTDTSATLYIDLKQQSCNNTVFTLLEGEPARIITEPYYLHYAIDSNSKQLEISKMFDSKLNKTNEISLIDKEPGKKKYTFLILKGVLDQPESVIFENNTYKPIICEPTFHVRLKKTPLTVAVNDVELKTEQTNLSVTNYDAVAYYKYREGELVDISCGKRDECGQLELKYGKLETKTVVHRATLSTAYALRLQVKLESQDSGRYFTCKIHNENDFATVRVYFQPESEPEDDIIIRVNGLKLRPQSTTGSEIRVQDFSYKFKYNESLMVSCEKRKGLLSGLLRLNTARAKCINGNAFCSTEEILTDKRNVICEYFYKNESKLTANIRFISDDMQDFYILGMPPDNIKHQYRQNQQPKMIISEYEYLDGEKLTLTCMKSKLSPNMVYTLEWDFPSEYLPKIKTSAQKGTAIKSSFVLTSAIHNKELKCLVYEHVPDQHYRNNEKTILDLTIAVKLIMRKLEPTTTPAPATSTDKGGIVEEEDPNKIILYGIGGGLCILVLILILMVYSISKRKKLRKRDSNINYENLPHNPNNTISPPTQWNEEQYARPVDLREDTDTYSVPYNEKNLENLYAKPQPKVLRNKKKENSENFEPTYSEVGKRNVKDCNDPNYAQVLPKSLRNNLKEENMNNYANVTDSSNYAEVLPKNQRKNYVLPKDGSNYAEIAAEVLRKPDNSNNYVNVNNDSHYAEVVHSINNRNKYVNVIPNNEPYVNVNSSDYAEPAYCELNIKNNKK